MARRRQNANQLTFSDTPRRRRVRLADRGNTPVYQTRTLIGGAERLGATSTVDTAT